jgi:hypothetical protein
MQSESLRLTDGNPGEHRLEISKLEEDRLAAEAPPVNTRAIWIATGISLAFAAFASLGVWKAVVNQEIDGRLPMGIICGLFVLVALGIALRFVGLVTYKCILIIDGEEVLFERVYFWIPRRIWAARSDVEYVQCYAANIPKGPLVVSVCLHFSESLPVISVLFRESASEAGKGYRDDVGLPAHGLTCAEAAALALETADQIASCLGIEHRRFAT